MEEKKAIKRVRKTKEVKEEHNNIDSITFENTEKDINIKEIVTLQEVINKEVINKEVINKEVINKDVINKEVINKEIKTTKPKKISIPRKKKEPNTNIINPINPINPININTLESLLNEDEPEQHLEQHLEIQDSHQERTELTELTERTERTETPITTYPYTSHITNIYHLSDLHIQLYKRHNEYQSVFDKVIDYLKQEKQKHKQNIPSNKNCDIPIIALITGDILHSKSDLSPECIQLTYNFLKAISNIMPLVIIPGNHDINMNNRERLDALTPIISDLPKSNPIYYLLESGVYQISNLLFYHASIFDYQIIPPNPNKKKNKELTHIMLYHGRVNGAVLYNGLEITSDSNKTITPSTFSGYDITCLGDIHKHQFLTPNIAYAGSLIQQNHGEDPLEHGLIKWDIVSRRGIHIPIQNEWSYITLYVDSKKASHQCANKDGSHDPECTLSKNLRVRVLYKNTPESFISDYITLLKMNHTVHEFSYQQDLDNFMRKDGDNGDDNDGDGNDDNDDDNDNDDDDNDDEFKNIQNPTRKGARMREPSVPSLDITSSELQNKFLIEYINQNEPNITPEQIEGIKELNIKQNQILKESNKNYSTQGFSGHYKLKRIEFSNLFSFGMRNVIDFTNFKGIVGIIAPNHLGKSAILDIIIYALFDKFTRKGSTRDILNVRSDFFIINLEVSIGQWTYTIIKNGTLSKTNTVTSKIEFFRTHDIEHTVEHLEEDNATKTKERITELFGCYEDIINTSFSIQHDNSCFIDSENTDRRKELQRIMRFDIIDKLGEMANQSLTKYKDIREHISKKINNDFIVNTKKAKNKAEKLLALHTENKLYAKNKIRTLHNSILEISNKLNSDCINFLRQHSQEDAETELESLTEQIDSNNNESKLIIEELQNNTLSNSTISNSTLSNSTTEYINLLKQSILDSEIKNNEIIKDTIKKKKIREQDNDKLYKSRKPTNINCENYSKILITDEGYSPSGPYVVKRLPNNNLEILNELKTIQNDEINLHQSSITLIENKINNLREKENKIELNNERILSLEKQMIKLPDSLLELVTDSLENLYEEYTCSLDNWIDTLQSTGKTTPLETILLSQPYKNFETSAKQYFVSKEILEYKSKIDSSTSSNSSNSNEEFILEQQSVLEQENINIKNELKTIRTLESQIKQLESKISSNKIQIQQIGNDISNMSSNKIIDNEINLNKKEKEKYEERITFIEAENSILQTKTKLIIKFEKLQTENVYLDKELKIVENILIQFDKYKTQIEDNTKIQNELSRLQIELAEFEEVFEEVEKQFNIESTNLTKNNSLLDQLRKDVAEHKSIESNLTLYTIYKKALKQLPYLLLAKIQPLLEKKVNDLLSIITDFTLKIDMSDSKIDIFIDRDIYKNNMLNSKSNSSSSSSSKNQRHILVNNASGFERFVSSLAIRIALLDISNLPKLNFMAIDEGWSAFDTTNLNNIGQIMDYLKTKFEFILTISHLTEIKQYCDQMIGLKKDDKGYSKIII